jgi:hypothetical protein
MTELVVFDTHSRICGCYYVALSTVLLPSCSLAQARRTTNIYNAAAEGEYKTLVRAGIRVRTPDVIPAHTIQFTPFYKETYQISGLTQDESGMK